MNNAENYEAWNKKVEDLKNKLLDKDALLRQYDLWLESSEDVTNYKGEDVYHRLLGAMQVLSDFDFIPGIGCSNFVAVIDRVQKETGLDLGVCKFLDYEAKETQAPHLPKCKAKEGLLVACLTSCLPPARKDCPHRNAKIGDYPRKF